MYRRTAAVVLFTGLIGTLVAFASYAQQHDHTDSTTALKVPLTIWLFSVPP